MGLSDEPLTRFFDQAPDEMRNVFARQPSAYGAQAREPSIVLREKSPVLSETGEYSLSL